MICSKIKLIKVFPFRRAISQRFLSILRWLLLHLERRPLDLKINLKVLINLQVLQDRKKKVTGGALWSKQGAHGKFLTTFFPPISEEITEEIKASLKWEWQPHTLNKAKILDKYRINYLKHQMKAVYHDVYQMKACHQGSRLDKHLMVALFWSLSTKGQCCFHGRCDLENDRVCFLVTITLTT